MPQAKILKRLVNQLEDKGMPPNMAHAVAVKKLQESGNLKKGSTEPTKKGLVRGDMTPAERAKDRAIKNSKTKVTAKDLVYNAKTNSVHRKKN